MNDLDTFKDFAQRASAAQREIDAITGLDALQRLWKIAHGHSGQCRIVACFLLGLFERLGVPERDLERLARDWRISS